MDSAINLIRSVFMAAEEGIIIADRSGEITAANPKSEEIFGYESGELEGIMIDQLLPKKKRKLHAGLREEYANKPRARPMGIGIDLYGLKKNGEVFPLEISLSHFVQRGEFFVTAFITDITERKKIERELAEHTQKLEVSVKERTGELERLNIGLRKEVEERKNAEKALRESQQLYALVANNFPKGTVSILDKDLRYVFSGGDKNESSQPGNHFLLKFPENEKQIIAQNLQNAKSGISSSCEFELENKSFIMHTVPVGHNSKKVNQILVVEENITELKKAEKEVRMALTKERELNEMKSRFVAMASHEFRTPLTTILSSINLISRYTESADQPKRDKHINRIKSSVKNLTEILNDFLSLEKLESGAIHVEGQAVDLVELVHQLVEENAGLLKKGQEVVVCGEKQLQAITDPKILKNILLNLYSNAIKYSGQDDKIAFYVASKSDKIFEIAVEDHGIGIPQEEQNKLFERFFRAGNATNIQGTGLGLHIVNKYVNLLNGKLSMDSTEGEGTTVTITIPQL